MGAGKWEMGVPVSLPWPFLSARCCTYLTQRSSSTLPASHSRTSPAVLMRKLRPSVPQLAMVTAVGQGQSPPRQPSLGQACSLRSPPVRSSCLLGLGLLNRTEPRFKAGMEGVVDSG